MSLGFIYIHFSKKLDFSASFIVSSNVIGGLSIKSSLNALTGAAASIAKAYWLPLKFI